MDLHAIETLYASRTFWPHCRTASATNHSYCEWWGYNEEAAWRHTGTVLHLANVYVAEIGGEPASLKWEEGYFAPLNYEFSRNNS